MSSITSAGAVLTAAFFFSMSVSDNVAAVRDRINAAVQRAKRSPEEIMLMAVSKTHPPETIREAYEAGLRIFGENRVQEFAGKVDALLDLRDAEWHLIGHLQTNKAAKAVDMFRAVDSVDSLKLAEKLDSVAHKLDRKLAVLIEVNVGREAAKSGVAPDSVALEELLIAAPRLESLQFRGLMTVPPFTDDPEGARPYFSKLRQLRDAIAARKLPAVSMDQLSMGMSHDFEIAIEEGSTCVRVGTAIFGQRTKT
jgi:pyridoxal phosphate enzyme (YggS family)